VNCPFLVAGAMFQISAFQKSNVWIIGGVSWWAYWLSVGRKHHGPEGSWLDLSRESPLAVPSAKML